MNAPLKAKPKKAEFAWHDPLLLESQLTEAERMVRDAARAFAQGKLQPRVLEAFRHEKADPSLLREMGALGFLGPTLPPEYGGAGINHVSYGLIARELERVDSGYRSTMSVQSSLVMTPIHEFGSDAHKKKYLPKLAKGELIGCFGLTEPNQRSDRRSVPDLGEDRRRTHPRLSRGKGRKGALGARDPRQAGATHLDHRRSRDGRGVRSGGEPAPRRRGFKRPVHLPERGALRNRLGRAGRGRGLLAPRPPVRARPQAVRPAARREPADPEKTRRHADRNMPGPAGRAALRAHEGRRQRYARDHLDHEAQLLRQGSRDRAPRARHAGRQRDLGRVRRGAPHGEPRGGEHLRGHARYPRAHSRAGADGDSGVFVISPGCADVARGTDAAHHSSRLFDLLRPPAELAVAPSRRRFGSRR